MLHQKHKSPKLPHISRIIASNMIVIILFSGCGQSSKEEPAPQRTSTQEQQQSEKIPTQLKSMESSIEQIIKTLDGPAVNVKEEKPQKEGQGQEGDQKSQDSQDQQGGGQNEKQDQGSDGQGDQKQQGEKENQGVQQNKQQKQPQDPWEKITPIVNDVHYKWNSYMPLAVKKGADKKLIDNFSKALNSLTNTIITKNKTNTLMASSFLYAYIPDFYSLYKTSSSPEIKRIRYYTRNAMLNAMTANWTQADYDMNSLKSSWALYKNILEKEQQDSSNQLDFSIYELDKVVKERNQPIIDIKGRIAMSNIEALEKSMEKASKKSGQQGEGGNQQEGS